MKLLLNGEPLEAEGLSADATLADVLAALEASLDQSGLTIIEIHADQEVVSPDDAEELGRRSVADFAEVDFLAVRASDLVRMGIEDGEEALQHLDESAHTIANALRLGDVKKAMDGFIEILDGLEWLESMIRNLDKGFPERFQESSLEMQRQSLRERLETTVREARNSQENQDWVGLADVLEYEFPDLLGECRTLFATAREERK